MQCRPWVDRSDTRLRGLVPQKKRVNFSHETLDVNWANFTIPKQLPFDAPVPAKVATDVRQDWRHQMRHGRLVLLSGSRPFPPARHRTDTAQECFYNIGWGDVKLSGVEKRIPEIEHRIPKNLQVRLNRGFKRKNTLPMQLSPTKEKRNARVRDTAAARRQEAVAVCKSEAKYMNKAIAIAGNGMSLPDLASIFLPVILTFPNDEHSSLFEHNLPRPAQRRPRQWKDGILSFDPLGHIAGIIKSAASGASEQIDAETTKSSAGDIDGDDSASA